MRDDVINLVITQSLVVSAFIPIAA